MQNKGSYLHSCSLCLDHATYSRHRSANAPTDLGPPAQGARRRGRFPERWCLKTVGVPRVIYSPASDSILDDSRMGPRVCSGSQPAEKGKCLRKPLFNCKGIRLHYHCVHLKISYTNVGTICNKILGRVPVSFH